MWFRTMCLLDVSLDYGSQSGLIHEQPWVHKEDVCLLPTNILVWTHGSMVVEGLFPVSEQRESRDSSPRALGHSAPMLLEPF